jgi:hypothetical protein
MIRPSRTAACLFLSVLATGIAPGPARGQATIGNITTDPFAFYYQYYLPNQQMQAMRPRPSDVINEAVVNRQYYAQTQRQSLYNPISPYAEGEFDPLRPYSQQQGKERIAAPYRFVQNSSNANGTGPGLYYNRAAQYFPGLRAGRGPNANLAPVRGGRGGGFRGGMGGFGGMGAMGGMGGMGGFG